LIWACGDEDLEFRLRRNRGGQFVIEGVDAFDDDRLLRPQLDPAADDAVAFGEVKLRQIGRLAIDEVEHVLVEIIDIEGIDGFKIRLAIFAIGDIAALCVVIVIDRDPNRADAAGKSSILKRLAKVVLPC
jgi:hypothetical protein